MQNITQPRQAGRRTLALTAALLVVAGLGLASTTVAQSKYDKVQITTTALNGDLYMLQGAGGNIGVSVGDDGVLVIDTQHAPLSTKILAAIKAISDQPIRYVINTHWHHDHTGGNQNFAANGATIVAHKNLRTRLMSKQVLKAWKMEFPAMPAQALPTITYSDELTLHFNGNAVHIKHPPLAHTDGDSIVYFPQANVLHMGDTLATGRFPFVDRGAFGSVLGLIAAYEYAISITNEQTQVIPGHGALTDRQHLKDALAMFKLSRATVVPLMAAGKSRDDIIAAKPLDEIAKKWGNSWMTADFFTEIIYDTETARQQPATTK